MTTAGSGVTIWQQEVPTYCAAQCERVRMRFVPVVSRAPWAYVYTYIHMYMYIYCMYICIIRARCTRVFKWSNRHEAATARRLFMKQLLDAAEATPSERLALARSIPPPPFTCGECIGCPRRISKISKHIISCVKSETLLCRKVITRYKFQISYYNFNDRIFWCLINLLVHYLIKNYILLG